MAEPPQPIARWLHGLPSNALKRSTGAIVAFVSLGLCVSNIVNYLDEIKTKTPNPVPPAAWAAQDLEEYV
ncbi:MAG: hypothetical protein AAGA75_27100 [Cyanobacteria bacterium P01_E01_bin.6]